MFAAIIFCGLILNKEELIKLIRWFIIISHHTSHKRSTSGPRVSSGLFRWLLPSTSLPKYTD
jgi:hypothetical protein